MTMTTPLPVTSIEAVLDGSQFTGGFESMTSRKTTSAAIVQCSTSNHGCKSHSKIEPDDGVK